jgi:ribose transport system substrate-binding protein
VIYRPISKLGATAVLAVAVAGVIAGCGSSDNATATSQASNASSSQPSQSSGQITAELTKLERRPTQIGITAPIKGGVPKGKKIVFLQCAVPACVNIGNAMQAATNSLGWQLSRINLGASPTTVVAAWQEALRQNPDGIAVTGGYPVAYFRQELAQATSQKIPVVAFSYQHQGKPFSLVIGSGDVQGEQAGDEAALFVASKIKSGDILAVNIQGVGAVVSELAAFKSSIAKDCPACSVQTINIAPADVGSTAATDIANYLVGHSNVKFMFLTTIDFALGLPAAMSAVSLPPVPSVSATEDTAGLNLIQQKQGGLEATAFWVSIEGAYRAIDAFARIFRGQSVAPDQDATVPKWLVTSQNITSQRPLPAVENYAQQFDKLWGVQ